MTNGSEERFEFHDGAVRLEGVASRPEELRAWVIFAHGSGSNRLSPRNRVVAHLLRQAGFGSLLIDLLDPAEADRYENRFDIARLTRRLLIATRAFLRVPGTAGMPIGYFGASTGAAAALEAAAVLGRRIGAIVSRGGRPDLALDALPRVESPTLLIVGGRDDEVLALNRHALRRMRCSCRLDVVPDASHLFEEPGALEEAAVLAADWFTVHLAAPRARRRHAASGAGDAPNSGAVC
jgi:putative phosphoribosyl transferase